MESSRNLFLINPDININDARVIWNSGTTPSRFVDWSSTNQLNDSFHQSTSTTASDVGIATAASSQGGGGEGAVHALMVKTHPHLSPFSSYLYSGGPGVAGGGFQFPDPHLMCLKLGKRHYFGDGGATPVGDRQGLAVGLSSLDNGKRGKPYYELIGGAPTTSTPSGVTVAAPAPPMGVVMVPRCQVDGCQVALVDAKDYHRRHKVCEMHSKAPKVVVLGLEQRFCQQCSRFHSVGEFDESKRSCRRRLAGHNERRRKSAHDQPTPRNQPSQVNRRMMNHGGRHPQFPLSNNNNGCALSLLSSSKNGSWISSGVDLPARCSAALNELIAENRAAVVARQQLILDHQHQHQHPSNVEVSARQNGSSSLPNYQHQIGTTGSHLTLDLMQAPSSAFGLLSVRGKSKENDQECPDLWSSFGGAHVV